MTALDQTLRALTPQVLGAVVRRFGDFAAAEDAVQEALLAAATSWPRDGVPDEPRAWLIRVASRRRIDHVRAEAARRRREEEVDRERDWVVAPPALGAREEDDTLILLFMCCHPALTRTSAIALTLRAVGGLTTAEIARAFLVPEATMAQRISRAKQLIHGSGAGFAMPTDDERAARLAAVMHVLYLIFNEGYASSSGALLARVDLSSEALRLTRELVSGLGEAGEPEASGLLALMLLTDARRAARTGPGGALIPLDEQDRARWDRAAIAEGVALLERTLPRGAVGAYQLQAAIAAVHDEAARVEETDWPQIVALYGVLMKRSDNPMVALNHAVAVAMVRGPAVGLALIAELESRLAGSHRVDAVRGHLHERAGDRAAARACYRRAAARTTSLVERDYLLARAARVEVD